MRRIVVFVILVHVSLHVSAIETFQGDRLVRLPCQFPTFNLTNTSVVWIRRDLSPPTVHQRQPEGDQLKDQNQLYRDRTSMRTDALDSGDLSLNLTDLQLSDSGTYTCSVRDSVGEQSQENIKLKVRKRSPLWTRALLVLLVFAVLVLSGSFLIHYRHRFLSGYKTDVEVESGVASVLLPCRATVHLPEDAKVEWRDRNRQKVHVFKSGPDGPEEQLQFYRTRTTMNQDLLTTGDLSLTLRHPTRADTDTYTCTIYSSRRRILMRKIVTLQVKVPQLEVQSGAESVLLPCETTFDLPEDALVEWRDSDNGLVHQYRTGLNQLTEQYWSYRTRTRMNEDLLRTGDLSLTLEHPTYEDRNTFTCTVHSREGTVLMKKQVDLQVKDCQVEVEKGVESVLLPFQTTPDLPKDAKVVWWRFDPEPVEKIFMHPPQNQVYRSRNKIRTRTRVNEDLLRTGDLSLTLDLPTERDRGWYRCGVWTKGSLLTWTSVLLKAKGSVLALDQSEDSRNRSGSVDDAMIPLMSAQTD